MNKENIKNLVASQGWKEVMELFNEEILAEKDLTKLNLEKRYEDIAIDTIARAKAQKIVKSVLKKVNNLAGQTDLPKESFI
jgi:hypothetical protein